MLKTIFVCEDGKKEQRGCRKCEIVSYFSRMWGVMETLEGLPSKSCEDLAGILITWAEEFIQKEEKDPLEFFMKKVQTIR